MPRPTIPLHRYIDELDERVQQLEAQAQAQATQIQDLRGDVRAQNLRIVNHLEGRLVAFFANERAVLGVAPAPAPVPPAHLNFPHHAHQVGRPVGQPAGPAGRQVTPGPAPAGPAPGPAIPPPAPKKPSGRDDTGRSMRAAVVQQRREPAPKYQGPKTSKNSL